jgi:hypothetical protein
VNQEQAGLIMLAVLALALGLAAWGWRSRRNAHRGWAQHLVLSAPEGQPVLELECLYIATTEADAPLQRVALSSLAYRAKATLGVYEAGVYFSPRGSTSVCFPADDSLQAGLATWTIDRVVEPEGMVMIRWSLGGHLVDSYFRLIDSDRDVLISAINGLQHSPAKGSHV